MQLLRGNIVLTASSVAKGYGLFKMSISLFIFVYIFFFPAVAISGEDSQLNDLLNKAEEKKLYNHRYWQVLLHYKPAHTGFKSLIDDTRLFLSPDGKTDPKAELEATIKALFQSDAKLVPEEPASEVLIGGSNRENDAHPKCRFIARYEWLKQELNK